MEKIGLFPPGSRNIAEQMKLSPGLKTGNFVYLTGITGSRVDGTMPKELSVQFHRVFEKIGEVLKEADLSFASIVEMTSFHIGLRDHFDLFNSVRGHYVKDPFPAWTAVEVAGLRREAAAVEVRTVAELL